MRGYPTHLINRVKSAGSHYLDADTLRFFDAYGGRCTDTSAQTVHLVESCANEWDGRRWRVVTFEFSPNGETVEVTAGDWQSNYQAHKTLNELTKTA